MSSSKHFWQSIDGHKLKLLYKAGVSWLSQHVDAINRMNVFPVPDGDTGINMYHTLKRAYEEIEPLDTDDITVIAQRFAHGTLMGARGNSGTILSQMMKGFADGLNGSKTLQSEQLLIALENSVKLAYQSVQDPVEGTILTVGRESVESLRQSFQADLMLDDMLEKLTSAAEISLYNTPNLLPVLKDAGVVDSGGMGLFFFLQGMARYRNGEDISEFASLENLSSGDDAEWENALIPDDEEGYGYDVQFLMLGEAMDVKQVRSDFENMGWSTLVVGDESMLKVHIHVHNPADPFNYAIGLGAELDDIVVENMHRQYEEYVRNRQQSHPQENIPSHGIAVVSVASGKGIIAIFNGLNCTHVISGGQTMNPSAEDFLTVVNQLPTDKIILLPNNSNIILTAKQTATLASDKDVRIIPTKTIMQGISAMIAYGGEINNDISLDDMIANMTEAIDYVLSIEVTQSIRSVELDGKAIIEGHYMGIVDGKIMTTNESLEATVVSVLEGVADDEYELATLYYGHEISEETANLLIERLSNDIKALEFEAVYGGQSLYPYLISVE